MMRTRQLARKPDPEAQHRRFIESACALECDAEKERFEEKLKQIAKAQPITQRAEKKRKP
jgi:hypothetical protein